MKMITNIALLCLTTIAFSQAQKDINTKTLQVVSTFGRLGADCSGRGICSFSETTNKTLTNSAIQYNADGTITLIIDRSKITKEDEAKIIGKQLKTSFKINQTVFIMQDDFELETASRSRLQIPSQLTKIQKGIYPINTTKEAFLITLKIE